MYSKVALVSALAAVAEARFNQEGLVQNAVQGLGNFGQPGQAGTLAGQTPGVLLAGANACAKLQLADTIVQTLGNDQAVIDAALVLVAAEKNFNPFAQSIPTLCGDASLPATAALRGVVPKVDPAVLGSDVQNANSAASITNPFQDAGLSVAQISIANGFSNFTIQNLDGSTAAAAGGAGAGAGAGAGNNQNNNQNNNNNNNAGQANCGAPTTLTRVVAAPAATQVNNNKGNNKGNNNNNQNNNQNNNGNNQNNNQNNNGNNQNNNQNNNGNNGGAGAAGGAADFGVCTPTMDFQFGRGNRDEKEGTFLPTDPLVAQGQQDALNPNIITNRICDQLTNVCKANQAAKDLCQQAKALVQSLGTKDATTATAFNQALGF